ncbi:MAG: biotin-dependent carboxyltransferase family protein, partial [Candidatus Eremiobacteraeota bacterium]|nr:biotin-dependent carboxyltransferase family protein [Candidatus Eremiobacteraeota bacterium]
PAAAVLTLRPGDRLAAAGGSWGAWTYLAVEGGIEVPLVLGSRSTHTRSTMGGYEGRALEAGDVLNARAAPLDALHEDGAIVAPWLERPQHGAVRIILGPQDDYFTPAALSTLFEAAYKVSPRFDRMGYWLDGPRLEHAHGFDIISDGIAAGAIQVPGEGLPLVLLADHQTTGGYPKIANLVRADFPRFVQRRPGEEVRFQRCEVAEAQRLLATARAQLEAPIQLAPLDGRRFHDALSTSNLIGGVHNPLE